MSLRAPRRLLFSFCTLAILAVGGFLSYESWQLYRSALDRVHSKLESEAVLLAEHAQLAFATANRLLADIAWEQLRETMTPFMSGRPMQQRVLNTTQFAGLVVTDEAGSPVYVINKVPLAPDSLANMTSLQAHRLGAPLIVGRPLSAGGEQHRLIPVSQRLVDKNGDFSGVATILLDAAYFRDFYRNVAKDQTLRIGMLHSNGHILTFHPTPSAKLPAFTEGLAALLATHQADTLRLTSPLDGNERLAAYRNIEQWPVAVTVSLGYDTFLNELMPAFRRNAILFLLFAGGGVLCTLLISRSMGEIYRARDARTLALREQASTMQLCHAIASRLPNGRVFVLDRQHRYEFVEGHLGDDCPTLEPAAMLGRHIDEIYPAETADKLKSLIANALQGQECEEEIAFRGRVFRTFGTPLPDDDGQIQRCLLLSQDITQFKADQALLVTLNHELHRQASTDGLLGIANRREFDRRLEQEWQRSLRERQPLSLLLLDVDYFKRYNDAYGHAEGDICLQQVATVVSEALHRSTDMVARYGGEELAVLLPNTDLEGAQHVAQRIHARQAELAIPFADSPVASYVTVSIGASTEIPPVDDSASQLIEQADQALYAAKEAGRNCTKAMSSIPAAEPGILKRLG